jgi:drug/metabolite transporter (DMT)-like permease
MVPQAHYKEIGMGSTKLIGLVLLVVGIALLFFGYQSTQSVGDQITETLTGRFTDETMWYLIGGAAAVVAGGFLAFVKK